MEVQTYIGSQTQIKESGDTISNTKKIFAAYCFYYSTEEKYTACTSSSLFFNLFICCVFQIVIKILL